LANSGLDPGKGGGKQHADHALNHGDPIGRRIGSGFLCHAKAIAHAPEPEMRCPFEEERKALPIPGDAEWPLPDARRQGGSA